MKKIVAIIISIAFSVSAMAQSGGAEGFSGPRLSAIGIGIGYYSPSFDYWKNRTDYDLGGGILPSLQIDAALFPYVNARLSAGYFSTSAELTRLESWGSEKIGLTLIPVSLSLYVPLNADAFTFYAGGGVDLTAITATYDSPSSSQKGTGSTTTGHILLGAERAFSNYSFGLEGKYLLGKYKQNLKFSAAGTEFMEEVSLNGIYAGISLKYRF
jgi:hypothetical protein